MRRIVLALAALAAFASAAAAAESFTFETLRRVAAVSAPDVSPDGRDVAFVVSRPDYEVDQNLSELWTVPVAGGEARQLTFSRKHAGAPAWSPDGAAIAFLAPAADDLTQVWLLPFRGGEARQVTRSATGVEQFAWRPDGSAIAYVAADTTAKKKGEEKFVTAFDVGAQDLFLRSKLPSRHIWLQEISGGAAKRLTGGGWSVEFVLPPSSPPSPLSWSPDGRTLAFARVPAPESGRFDSVSVALLDVASGTVKPFDDVKRWQSNPKFTPDGKALVYWMPRDGRGDAGLENQWWLKPLAGGEARSLTRALDRNVFTGEWLPDGRTLLVGANSEATTGLWTVPLEGAAKRVDTGGLVVNGAFGFDYTVARTGAIVFTATSPTRPAELYAMDSPGAKPRRLTRLNAWVDSVALGRTERVTWTNDGFTEDGVLVTPPGFDPAKKYPLVLVIHGGPTASSKTNFNTMAQLMAAEGWCVFSPNYRGSDNLGVAYQSAIHSDWGPGPGRDVMAGVAALEARGWVDRTRIAATGWSYGGYMTSWLIGNYPDKWRVAVAGAPVTSWADQYNLSDGNVSLRHDMGGSPWVGDRAEFYRQQSPITFATKAKAPTLVMAHMEDFRVPPAQAMSLYRALQDNGVETQFIGFPGRTHNPGDPVNQRERTKLWIEWVRRHFDDDVKLP
ncbi:MAG: S9 family peptidase [Candidatus Eisenbacteria bacterium]